MATVAEKIGLDQAREVWREADKRHMTDERRPHLRLQKVAEGPLNAPQEPRIFPTGYTPATITSVQRMKWIADRYTLLEELKQAVAAWVDAPENVDDTRLYGAVCDALDAVEATDPT